MLCETSFLTDLNAVFAYWVAPGDVPGGYPRFKTMDLLGRHLPTGVATPTPLLDPLHLAQVGKDDGSLQPNSLKSS